MSSLKTDVQDRRRPIAIDLFAGAGGLSLGFEQAGFDVAAAAEIDPVHSAVHEFNFPNCATLCADAADLTAADIRKAAAIGSAQIDVVFGGAPCQGFSMMGKRAIDDPRNRLLLEFVRLVTTLKASYFLFENVKGITIGKHRQLLDELIATFQESGYNVVLPYQVLNAADFGVPQDRQRLILMGARNGFKLPEYPTPGDVQKTTVWQAIGDLPDPERYEELNDTDSTNRAQFAAASPYASILHGLKQDPSDFSHPRQWDRSRLTSSMRTVHTPLSQRRFSETRYGKVEPVSRFLKLNPAGLCNTLRAGTGSDRGAFTSPRPIHPYAPRCITVREAARLHSYPDWFRFHVTKWHGFRQIGNSVPPLLGRAVASEIVRALGVTPQKPSLHLPLGQESLLSMTVTQAARYYRVSSSVVGKRLRIADAEPSDQLSLAMA